MNSTELYSKGLALLVYGIAKDAQHWSFRDEVYKTPKIEVTHCGDLTVAPIELVRKAAIQ